MKLPEFTIPLIGNWVDVVVIAIGIFSVWEGWRRGFIALTFELVTLITAFFISLIFYQLPANILYVSFAFPHGLANSLSFAAIAIFTQQLTSFSLGNIEDKIPPKYHRYRWNIWGSLLPLLGNYTVVVILVLTILIGLPFRKDLKQSVLNSTASAFIMKNSFQLEKKFYALFNINKPSTYSFLSVSFVIKDSWVLHFKATDLESDTKAENKLLERINLIRSDGLRLLKPDPILQKLANQHAIDMLFQEILVHETGMPFTEKLKQADVNFTHATQLVALAPQESIAFYGFMDNLENKEYLTSPLYHKIGISVVDTGVFGKVFVIILTD